MADKAAIMRALQGGGGMGQKPPMGPPMGEPPEGGEGPEGMPKPGGDQPQGMDVRAIMTGLQGTAALLQAESQKGNPAAQKGEAQLKALLQTMAELTGNAQGGGPKPPEEGAENPEDPRMDIGPGTGPNPVRSFSRGKPAGTFQPSRVL